MTHTAPIDKLMTQALVTVQCFTKIINKMYPINMRVPRVTYNVTGTTAGQAYYERHLVDLNWNLYKQNPVYFLNHTIPHEVSHLASNLIHGPIHGRGHGKEWKIIMSLLGREPNRYHNLKV